MLIRAHSLNRGTATVRQISVLVSRITAVATNLLTIRAPITPLHADDFLGAYSGTNELHACCGSARPQARTDLWGTRMSSVVQLAVHSRDSTQRAALPTDSSG